MGNREITAFWLIFWHFLYKVDIKISKTSRIAAVFHRLTTNPFHFLSRVLPRFWGNAPTRLPDLREENASMPSKKTATVTAATQTLIDENFISSDAGNGWAACYHVI